MNLLEKLNPKVKKFKTSDLVIVNMITPSFYEETKDVLEGGHKHKERYFATNNKDGSYTLLSTGKSYTTIKGPLECVQINEKLTKLFVDNNYKLVTENEVFKCEAELNPHLKFDNFKVAKGVTRIKDGKTEKVDILIPEHIHYENRLDPYYASKPKLIKGNLVAPDGSIIKADKISPLKDEVFDIWNNYDSNGLHSKNPYMFMPHELEEFEINLEKNNIARNNLKTNNKTELADDLNEGR